MRGLEGALVKRKYCRMHYGTVTSRPFDESRDDAAHDTIWTKPETGEKMVEGCMIWVFRKVSKLLA